MSRLIDVEPILAMCDDPEVSEPYGIRGAVLERMMREAPIVNRPQGEWMFKDDDVFAGEYTCSNCNKRAEVDLYGQWILSNYCPSCGARMKGAE